MDFYARAAAYLDAFQADMKRDFHLIPNAEFGGRRFPLYGIFEFEDNSTLILRNGKCVRSYEFCYFDACEQLDEEALRDYCAVLDHMAAHYVPWRESSHGFSMLSMVVLTDGAPDRALQKLIRKYKHEEKRRREADGYGWCSARLCIVDMSAGTCYVNSHGRALANRIRRTTERLR